MRSSTSRCLIAASASRIAPSRSFSPARIALFMSSVMRSLSAMATRFALPGAAHAVAGHALHVALDGGGLLALALLRGLFIELAPTQLGENAGLLAGSLEAPQGGIEVLVLTHANARHRNLKSLIGMGISPERPVLRKPGPVERVGDSKGAPGIRQKPRPAPACWSRRPLVREPLLLQAFRQQGRRPVCRTPEEALRHAIDPLAGEAGRRHWRAGVVTVHAGTPRPRLANTSLARASPLEVRR